MTLKETIKRYKKHSECIQQTLITKEEAMTVYKLLEELEVKRQIITNVKEQCKVWKRNDFQNRDYGIGFISALGNIEGLIAYTEEQLEVTADGLKEDI